MSKRDKEIARMMGWKKSKENESPVIKINFKKLIPFIIGIILGIYLIGRIF